MGSTIAIASFSMDGRILSEDFTVLEKKAMGLLACKRTAEIVWSEASVSTVVGRFALKGTSEAALIFSLRELMVFIVVEYNGKVSFSSKG